MDKRKLVVTILLLSLASGCNSDKDNEYDNPGLSTDSSEEVIDSDNLPSEGEKPEQQDDPEIEDEEEGVLTMEEYSQYRAANDEVVIKELFSSLIDSSKELGRCDYSWEERSNISLCSGLVEMLDADFITLNPLENVTMFLNDKDGESFKYFCELRFTGRVCIPSEDLDYDFEELIALDVTITSDSVVTYGATYQVDPTDVPDEGDPLETTGEEEDELNGDVIPD